LSPRFWDFRRTRLMEVLSHKKLILSLRRKQNFVL
jgi:hypothetical protein